MNSWDKFLYLGLKMYGKDWKKIEILVGTRNGAQIRSHAQKFFSKLNKSNDEKSLSGKFDLQKLGYFQMIFFLTNIFI